MEESITSLSIVIPIFKGSNFIEKLLKRVDQTKNILSKSKVNLIEVICVCDEPIDDSLKIIKKLQDKGLIQLRVIPATGAEKFAEYIYDKLNDFVHVETKGRVRVTKVKFMEHGKNAASFIGGY